MPKKCAAPHRLFPFYLLFLVMVAPLFLASVKAIPRSPVSPEFWELRIHIKMKGNYETREGKTNYSGQYAYAAQWTGCLVADEPDFLIYYENDKLLEWKAQEKEKGQEGSKSLSTEEFSKKPRFEFNYILKKERQFHFDFAVDGFDIPQSPSRYKHPLLLAATAEHTERTGDNFYGRNITKGSNQIRIPQESFFGDRMSQSFSWSWKDERWMKREDGVVFLSHSHDVDVEVTIIPHFK